MQTGNKEMLVSPLRTFCQSHCFRMTLNYISTWNFNKWLNCHEVNPYLKANVKRQYIFTPQSVRRNLSETSVRTWDKKNNEIEKCNGSEHDVPLSPGWSTNRRFLHQLFTTGLQKQWSEQAQWSRDSVVDGCEARDYTSEDSCCNFRQRQKTLYVL
jgi:hypothetical protein